MRTLGGIILVQSASRVQDYLDIHTSALHVPGLEWHLLGKMAYITFILAQ